MILITRLALFCLMVNLYFPLCAQSPQSDSRHWQFSAGVQYDQGRNTITDPAPPLSSLSIGGNFEYVITFPRIKLVYFANLNFQRIEGEGSLIAYQNDFGLEETLSIDNIRTGPGIALKLNNKGRLHPLLGAQAFLGFPVNAEYDFQNVRMDIQYDLPLSFNAKGGASLYTGGQLFAGIEMTFSAKSKLRLKAALGQQSQFASWELPSPFLTPLYERARLIKGGYWQASLEVVHDL
ncbi:hypothetical protein [Lewinella cohaerens]|uniref:hypothetical protein n=1 Tax=Lewinella cohaerens TaxID=70995 RepID=UPI0003A43C63|nr:hypothetical protein [Lewinella cohaerens]